MGWECACMSTKSYANELCTKARDSLTLYIILLILLLYFYTNNQWIRKRCSHLCGAQHTRTIYGHLQFARHMNNTRLHRQPLHTEMWIQSVATTIGVEFVANDVSKIRQLWRYPLVRRTHTRACDFFMLVSLLIKMTGIVCSFALKSSDMSLDHSRKNSITSEHSALLSYLPPFHSTSTKSGYRTKSISDTNIIKRPTVNWL